MPMRARGDPTAENPMLRQEASGAIFARARRFGREHRLVAVASADGVSAGALGAAAARVAATERIADVALNHADDAFFDLLMRAAVLAAPALVQRAGTRVAAELRALIANIIAGH